MILILSFNSILFPCVWMLKRGLVFSLMIPCKAFYTGMLEVVLVFFRQRAAHASVCLRLLDPNALKLLLDFTGHNRPR